MTAGNELSTLKWRGCKDSPKDSCHMSLPSINGMSRTLGENDNDESRHIYLTETTITSFGTKKSCKSVLHRAGLE